MPSVNTAVVQGKIKSLEQIYLFSMPVKEYQIVEHFLGTALKDEVMKIMPVQKQTRAGQRTRFKVCPVQPEHHPCAEALTVPILRNLARHWDYGGSLRLCQSCMVL